MGSDLNSPVILRLNELASKARPEAGRPAVRPPLPRRTRRDRRAYRLIAATAHEVAFPKLPTLGYLKQSRLIERAQTGDIEARNTVWLHNARLAYSAAAKYHLETDLLADALQESQLGLARAIEKFEIDRLNALSTYAFHWLRQAIQRIQPRQRYSNKIPAHHWERFRAYRHHVAAAPTRNDWFDQRERLLDEDAKAYHQIIRVHAAACPERLEGDPGLVSETPASLDGLIARESLERLHQMIESLDPRMKLIIMHRFGMGDGVEYTLEQVGRQLGVTRERVRQLQREALRILKRKLEETLPASQIEPKPGERLAPGSNTMRQTPEIEDQTT